MISLVTSGRLVLCILASAGIHAGGAYLAWQESGIDQPPNREPVAVSLVRPAEVAALPDSPPSKLVPLPAAVDDAPQGRAAQVENAYVSPPEISPATAPSQEPPVPAAAPRAGRISADLVCVAPQDVTADPLVVDARTALLEPVPKDLQPAAETPRATPAAVVGGSGKAPSVTGGDVLVEAVPAYRSNPLPEYPYQARLRRWEGVVWLRVNVAADGTVDDLTVEESCGYRLLDRAARKSVRSWRFSPARKGGTPVASQVRIPVRFRLEDG